MRWSWLSACVLLAACNDPGASPLESARSHALRQAARQGIASADMPVLEPLAEHRAVGSTVERFAQVIDGLPVYHRELRMLLRDDGSLVTSTGRVFSARTRRSSPRFVDDEAAAIRRAVRHSYGDRAVRVEASRARKVWIPQPGVPDDSAELVAAWVVEAYTSEPTATSGDLRRTIIAGDGRVLADETLVADAAFSYRVWAEAIGEKQPADGPTADATPHPTGVPDKSYPAYVAPSLVSVDSLNDPGDPWLGVDATTTTGNNVDAYADLSAPNGLGSGDFRATASGSTFDHSYDTSKGPLVDTDQQMASITSLFYVLNWLHDFWYDAGFDEQAGNAQLSNYGRGGVEDDVLLAEAQDNAYGGARNNANMSTPDDGMSPRMQIYLWSGRDTRTMTLQPSGRKPEIGGAVYGPKNFTVIGQIVAGVDAGGASPTDGCTAPLDSVGGKVLLVDRGNCTFKTKTLAAQNAGAIALMVANNVGGDIPPGLGDDSTLPDTVTIPSISVTQAEGAAIRSELASGSVSATIHRAVAPELDGALDATLVAHEFGHYLHHRLAFCGNAMCRALSEGWGDFVALMLLARSGDDLTGAYPFSVYATQGYAGDPGYYGIRRAPYSVDFGINALSFRHMADREPLPTTHPIQPSNNNSEVHNAGEVWAAALWEGYVALQQQGGGTFDEIRAKMARYVVTGLAMTPIEASPMEARDAILAAALAADPADHATLIAAFARRGFGSCAVPPDKNSIDFIGIVESTVVAGNPQMVSFALTDGCDDDGVLDTGETARVRIRVANQGHAPLANLTFTITSQLAGVTIVSPPVQLDHLDPFATTDLDLEVALEPGLTEAIAGDLALQVTSSGGCEAVSKIPVAFRFNIDDVPLASAADSFDAFYSPWSPWTAAWSHVRETPLDGSWHGIDLAVQSDVSLTSPYLVASTNQPVTLSFTHRYAFELGTKAWDGGVVEVSNDNGVTWRDVAMLTTQTGYSGTISDESNNVLAGRLGFIGANAAWPDHETVTLDLGTALAGDVFQVRFRIGTDGGTGDYGWDIDDVALSGIVGTPFPAQLPDDGSCVLTEPPRDDTIYSGGGGCCDTGRRSNGVFALLVLGLLLRRRRRR
jgi:MYXO-CTERM domain-containing protein